MFPGTDAGRHQVAGQFHDKFGVADTLGAVDCTHVKIFPPPRPEGLQYINRKGIHSLNVQLVGFNCKLMVVLSVHEYKLTKILVKTILYFRWLMQTAGF